MTRAALSRPPVRLALIGAWVLCVLPFTGLGYGSDADAWLVARAADTMWRTHSYEASRSTGFPLFELLETPLVHAGGWRAANLLPLAGGVALLLALLRMAGQGRFRNPWFVLAAAALLPVIVKNASSTMDYLPGTALLVWSFAMLLEGRMYAAALLIGLASGFRPTNGLLLLPALVFLRTDGQRPMALLRVAVLATAAGAIAYAPALLNGGLRLSYAVMPLGAATRALLTGYNALQLLGVVGWLGLVAACVLPGRGEAHALPRAQRRFHLTVLVVWIALFALLPDEPEYLLPALPSLLMLADAMLTRTRAALALAALLSYHVARIEVLGGESGLRHPTFALREGYTAADVADRRFKLSVRDAASVCAVDQPTVLMYGSLWVPVRNAVWQWDAGLHMHRRIDGRLFLSDKILNADTLRILRARGLRIVLWNADKWEYYRADVPGWRESVEVVDDLSAFFGRPLDGHPLSMK